jgi:tol-pal system protein YbgF
MPMPRRLVALLIVALAGTTPAWAESDSARQMQAFDARLTRLESALQNQELLGLLKEVETLKAELARLRGQAEVHAHQLDTLGKRQNDLYVDLDQRLGELAKAARPPEAATVATPAPAASPAPAAAQPAPAAQPASAAAPAGPAAAAPAATPAAASSAAATPQLDPLVESRSYETALAHFREGNYVNAIAGFRGFLKAYPESTLAPNAQYWIGYSYYALKDYKSALAHQQKLLAAYPASAKVPDAMLNIATNQIALDNLDAAKKTLQELVAKHPGTQAATLASRRLSALK